jgi:alkylation response protein AidB-like acyl-CoA dehydrogenase
VSVTASIEERIAGLTPRIRAAAERIEQGRRLPGDLVAALAEAGAFRLCVPQSLGGLEVDVATLLRVIEAVAIADGSAGWCVMIGATTGVVSAYLEPTIAHQVYADPLAVTGGVFAPQGRAVAAEGGYRVSGRWSFASGCQHCAWLMGGCVVLEDGKPRIRRDGQPETRMFLFPAAEARIHDTWAVAGLCGTGSHDIEIHDAVVPGERSVALGFDRPHHEGALYRFPVFGLLAIGIAAVAIGIARDAIGELTRLALAKKPTSSSRRLADRGTVQAEIARAEADVRAAAAFLFDAVGRASEEARSGAISTASRVGLRLAASHATQASAMSVRRMYETGGGTSVYATSRLQRHFRDVHVATQHLMVAPSSWELAGRVLLGLDSDISQL